jgi:hypothetical protein
MSYRQNEPSSLREILALVVWVVVVLGVFALVLALIMNYLPDGVLKTWSVVFSAFVTAVVALLPLLLRWLGRKHNP